MGDYGRFECDSGCSLFTESAALPKKEWYSLKC